MNSSAVDCAPTRWRWVFLLFFAGPLGAFQYARVAYVLPGLLQQTAMSAFEQAVLLSSMGVVGVLAGTVGGALGQSLGLKRMLTGGLLLGAAGALMPLVFHSFASLLAARLVEGISHMAIAVAVPTLMLLLCAPKDKSSAMTLWSCYFTATFVVAALTMPWLLEVGRWQGIVGLHTALLVGVAGLVLRLLVLQRMPALPGSPDSQNPPMSAPLLPVSASVSLPIRQLLHAQGRLLTTSGLLVIPATFFGYTLLFVALVIALPALLSPLPDMQRWLALLLPTASLAGTLLCLAALRRGVASQRVVGLAVTGLLLAGIGLLLLPGHSAAARAAAGMAFVLLGTLPAGILSSLSTDFSAGDADIALVNGGVVQFGSLGTFVGAPLLASLLQPWGWPAIGGYLLLGTAVVALCPVLLRRAAATGGVSSGL